MNNGIEASKILTVALIKIHKINTHYCRDFPTELCCISLLQTCNVSRVKICDIMKGGSNKLL